MSKKWFLPGMGFIVILISHLTWYSWKAARVSAAWVQVSQKNVIVDYWSQGEYFLGLAYALAMAFTLFAIMKFREAKMRSVTGIAGGLTLAGVLYMGGCFLLGCCGSPLLVVYLTLFGAQFLGFTKPLIFIITLIMVIVGYFWVNKRTKETVACCEAPGNAPEERN